VDFPHFILTFFIFFFFFFMWKKIYIASQTMCVYIYIYHIYIFYKVCLFQKLLLLFFFFIERCFRLKIFSRKTNDIPFLWLIA
jgi:hypothetical protein